ncbi:unnamed protein product [Ceutorhynchus assimilis]|uniref:MADF domain-containing protein n=1 Tax=Ceutorhynchus assimilis TaxID=467358 RepID=A0A9N9MDJ8_9CUCU|nr:unnamed protein product [Ceutorhynchus assimilis]
MDVEKLIQEVYLRTPIWDQKIPSYHNRDLIAKLWQEVSTACGITVDVAKPKWKHLRDNFRAELKKAWKKKKSGDAGGSQACESSWVWFKNMLFLKDQMTGRKMQSNLPLPVQETELFDDQESQENTDVNPEKEENREQEQVADTHNEDEMPGTSKSISDKKTKRARNTSLNSALLDLEKKKIKLIESHLQNSQTSFPQDDCHQFLMSLHKPLISLPIDRQMYVRFKFQELIFQETNNAVNCQYLDNRSIQHSQHSSRSRMSTSSPAEYSDSQSRTSFTPIHHTEHINPLSPPTSSV